IHRKQVVSDGSFAYVGGMSVADRYITGGKNFDSWRDIHVRVTGPIALGVQRSFITDWSFMSSKAGELPEADFNIDIHKTYPTNDEKLLTMQLVRSGPTSQWYNIELIYLKAISSARQRVYLETPYFLPTEGLLNALQTASLSGVDVRILIPYKSDSPILTLASASYIAECLRAGIKVYRYTPGMLHSKMLIIDDELVSIGSTNFDFRSFEHNFELTMLIYSTEFNQQATEIFRHGLSQAERVNAAEWNTRGRVTRMKESLTRLFAPIL
ncbi:MAG: cardiolipin synthase, partial [Muribaculaceae bacterium]|nr:cardiolipin synthase [Muribaculaceae bacterium]